VYFKYPYEVARHESLPSYREMDMSEPKIDTKLAGGLKSGYPGLSNPPVYHASTVTFSSAAEFEAQQRDRHNAFFYGRLGTPTAFSLEEAMADLEGGFRSIAVCSGTAAAVTSILAFARAGDTVLMPDNAWGPIRNLARGLLKSLGITTLFYDPMAGTEIEDLVDEHTKLLYLESPGSLTYEVQDTRTLVAVARRLGVATVIDNTWGAPLFFKPIELGVDISFIAATKFIVGHSDAVIGLVVCRDEAVYDKARNVAAGLGYHAAPDDCYLAFRGLRSAALRMRQHERQGLELTHWLAARPEVARVLHPALPTAVGHAFWKRDFKGSSGVFGVELMPTPDAALDAMLRGFDHFAIGASWGGLQSIIIRTYPERVRTVRPWTGGPVLRIHTGLEDIGDLIGDLERAVNRLNEAK
jgi:cystathionine beta-lyase